jgi:hypothetical protein
VEKTTRYSEVSPPFRSDMGWGAYFIVNVNVTALYLGWTLLSKTRERAWSIKGTYDESSLVGDKIINSKTVLLALWSRRCLWFNTKTLALLQLVNFLCEKTRRFNFIDFSSIKHSSISSKQTPSKLFTKIKSLAWWWINKFSSERWKVVFDVFIRLSGSDNIWVYPEALNYVKLRQYFIISEMNLIKFGPRTNCRPLRCFSVVSTVKMSQSMRCSCKLEPLTLNKN